MTAVVRWAHLSDEELLKLRFCDLQLDFERTPVARALHRLHRELAGRGVRFKPHAWLAEEWFSPDGVPGIAVPFYLAHPRLERLERRLCGEVEGGNARWLMRILRHEAGHALDTAYRLRRRRRWREVFGPASLPYPDRYRARPGSRRYVHHLGDWYAQAHPTEDFAETFAVWLTPRSGWRRSYSEWPALQKLELVEEFMREASERRPPVRNRDRIEPLTTNRRTLAEHYRRKLAQRAQFRRSATDELLRKIFTDQPRRANALRASVLLRSSKPALIAALVRETGIDRYSLFQITRTVIERSSKMRLHVRGNRRDALRNARWLIAHLAHHYSQVASPPLHL